VPGIFCLLAHHSAVLANVNAGLMAAMKIELGVDVSPETLS